MKLIVLLIFLSLLTACSGIKDAGMIYQDRFDFSSVTHYSLYQRNSGFIEQQNISEIIRNGLEIAIEQAMDEKGFLYSTIVEADIIVSYYIVSNKKSDYSLYNKAVRYCDQCLIANNWKKDQKNWQLKAGSLLIDLIDTKTKRSVWRSVYPLNIDVKDNSREVNKKIQIAVKTMLLLYPTQANGKINA